MVCARDTRLDGEAVSKGLGGPVALVPRGLRGNPLFRKIGVPVYCTYARTIVFLPVRLSLSTAFPKPAPTC